MALLFRLLHSPKPVVLLTLLVLLAGASSAWAQDGDLFRDLERSADAVAERRDSPPPSLADLRESRREAYNSYLRAARTGGDVSEAWHRYQAASLALEEALRGGGSNLEGGPAEGGRFVDFGHAEGTSGPETSEVDLVGPDSTTVTLETAFPDAAAREERRAAGRELVQVIASTRTTLEMVTGFLNSRSGGGRSGAVVDQALADLETRLASVDPAAGGESVPRLRLQVASLRGTLRTYRSLDTEGYAWFNPVRYWRAVRRYFVRESARTRLSTVWAALGRVERDLAFIEVLPPKPEPPERPPLPGEGGVSGTGRTGLQVLPHVKVYFNEPPQGQGLAEGLIEVLGKATDPERHRIEAHFYQVDHMGIVGAFTAAARRIGPEDVRFITEDDYLHYAEHHPNAPPGRPERDAYERAYGALAAAGIEVISDASFGNGGHALSHNKFAVVNDRWVWSGSFNLTEDGATKNANNAILVDSPDMAAIYHRQFESMWSGKAFGTKKKDDGPRRVRVDGHEVEVYFSPNDAANVEIAQEIRAADASCYVAAFVLSDHRIVNALRERAEAGVDVRVMTDNLGASTTLPFDILTRERVSVRDYLTGLGIPMKDDGASAMMHHKFAVIDAGTSLDPVVITGSHNWSAQADATNDENVQIWHAGPVAQVYFSEFQRLWGEPFTAPSRARASHPPGSAGRLRITAVDTSSDTLGDWVAITCDSTGGGSNLSLEGRSLARMRSRESFVFPAGSTIRPGETILVYREGAGAPESSSGGPWAVTYRAPDLWLTSTDGAVALRDRYGRVSDAVLWANHDGRLTSSAVPFMKELAAEEAWDVDKGVTLSEEMFLDSRQFKKKRHLVRTGDRDTNTPADWTAAPDTF